MSLAFTNKKSTSTTAVAANTTTTLKSKVEEKMPLYDSLDLGALGLSRQAFEYALMGFNNLLDAGKIKKDNLLSILDFSLPSGKKRLFVIDLATGELVFNTYAAHGRNSGTSVATRFSNKMNSYQSSLGFYITGDTYNGKHGTSLRLQGEEKGINDNALARGIVMHSASYVDESIIASQGFIGRSQGCPALPGNVYKDVINKIKDGSCLFLYSPDKFYTTHSKFLNEKA
ncbi:murein L,D-transpeptidase catalytic domain family protein [Sediminibacterium roseum]|nr:murein L,D-transpeptidase catalytic domain family protein [Sediminibacterium roseum]